MHLVISLPRCTYVAILEYGSWKQISPANAIWTMPSPSISSDRSSSFAPAVSSPSMFFAATSSWFSSAPSSAVPPRPVSLSVPSPALPELSAEPCCVSFKECSPSVCCVDTVCIRSSVRERSFKSTIENTIKSAAIQSASIERISRFLALRFLLFNLSEWLLFPLNCFPHFYFTICFFIFTLHTYYKEIVRKVPVIYMLPSPA